MTFFNDLSHPHAEGLSRIAEAQALRIAELEPMVERMDLYISGWRERGDRIAELETTLSAARARAERAEKAIRDYLAGNYDHPRAHRPGKCRHDIWYWEACENCIDEHFTAALVDATPPSE